MIHNLILRATCLAICVLACVLTAPLLPLLWLWNWALPRQFWNGGLDRPQ